MDFVERKSVQEVVKKEWDGSCGRYEGRQIIYSEKVIRGLELCTLNMKCAKEECPYYPKDDCFQSMHEDALSLLKAQESRVMTLEEVKAIPYDADIWIETEYYVGKITIFAATINTKGLRGVMVYGSHKTYDYEAYNKLWRCWTSRPSDLERENTPWE